MSWNAVSGASGYEIQRYLYDGTQDPVVSEWRDLIGATANTVTTVSGGGTTSVTDTNNAITASKTYLYRVRTVKEELKSGWSAVVSGTTRAANPTAPALDSQSTGMSMIRLSWKAVSGATNYELQWLEGPHTAATFNNDTISRSTITIGGNLRHYVHTGRKTGALYSYRLRATLPQGAASGWSAVERQYTRPPAPNLTTSNVKNTEITLKWDAVKFVPDPGNSDSPDRLIAADNYRVEWRKAGSSTWDALGESLAACTNNKCTVTDAGLDKNTRYYYRIRATVTRTPSGGSSTVYTSYWDYADNTTTND